MKGLKEFTKNALKYCRYWQIFVKIILIIILSIFIYVYYEDNINYTSIQATIKKADCKQNVKVVQERYSSHNELYSDCQLIVEYIIDGHTYNQSLRTINDKYYKGERLYIDYENKNKKNIRIHDITKKIIFYGCIFGLIILLGILYLITFHPDKSIVKWLIGILCFRSLTN
tara:strand:+ start:23 stop:535 length:513 start_codon:yes stop_codon:yes gene_type:complete